MIRALAFGFMLSLGPQLWALDCAEFMMRPGYGSADEIYLLRRFAERAHENQTFHGIPYIDHLDAVAGVLIDSGYNNLEDPFHVAILKAAYLVDLIHNSKFSSPAEIYFMLQPITGTALAEAALRMGTPERLRGSEVATLAELASRIAKFKSDIWYAPDIFARLYIDEFRRFRKTAYVPGQAEDLWNALEVIVNELEKDRF